MRPPAGGLLHQIVPLLGAALWQAQSHPLELREFSVGRTARPVYVLDPARLRPGASWLESVFPPDRKRVRLFFDMRKSSVVGQSLDYRLLVREGEPLWVRHWLVARTRARNGRWQLQGLLQAIPEQKQLEWECLQISERVRNRIGQELHDDLCQVLTGLTCMMQVVSKRAATRAPTVAAEIHVLNRELMSATNRVRAMAHGLFPAQLDHLTLRHALNEFARQTKARYAVKVLVGVTGKLAPHSPEQILQLYRIAQEAVGNAVRHGKATAIRIFVTASAHRMHVRIEDNGSGFPSTEVRSEGIGLRVMQYRARLLGGELRIRNLSRRGAVVELKYPLAASNVTRRLTQS